MGSSQSKDSEALVDANVGYCVAQNTPLEDFGRRYFLRRIHINFNARNVCIRPDRVGGGVALGRIKFNSQDYTTEIKSPLYSVQVSWGEKLRMKCVSVSVNGNSE